MATKEQILAARKRVGESQVVFGHRFGVDGATISRWEDADGRGPPTSGLRAGQIDNVLSQIAGALPVELAAEPIQDKGP